MPNKKELSGKEVYHLQKIGLDPVTDWLAQKMVT